MKEDFDGLSEAELLLSLAIDMALVASRTELLKLLNERVKSLFGANEFGISQIDPDGKYTSVFLMGVQEETKRILGYGETVAAKYEIEDPIFLQLLNEDRPILINVNELGDISGLPSYVHFWKKVGITRLVIGPLKIAQTCIGAVVFVLGKDKVVSPESKILRGICSQISVAMANILAREKIESSEKEKAKLLEFSNAMASSRDKGEIGKIVKRYLFEFFGIQDYTIHSISPDKLYHRPTLFDKDSDFAGIPEFQRLMQIDTPVGDGVFNKILKTEEFIVLRGDNGFSLSPVSANEKTWVQVGLTQMAGVAIRFGVENIGVLIFKIDDPEILNTELPLLKSICSQIAIALANIQANDEIEKQLNQIEGFRHQLELEKVYLKDELEKTNNPSEIIGNGSRMVEVFKLVSQVSKVDSTVLLLGETGTGKELVARAIHDLSPRKNRLMVKINCAALPANLVESQLFGHEKGSFTGAVDRGIGKFELADKGTLFLDEIGEMPLELQAKLLRAIQEKEIERIGGKAPIQVDVRIISATNRNLAKLVEEGRFRADLYYRLNIFPILLPPLRDRKEDILDLAKYFIQKFSKKVGKNITGISPYVVEELQDYDWPGNVRELEHVIERSILMASEETIRKIYLPNQTEKGKLKIKPDPFKVKTIFENEKEYILKVLRYVNFRISGKDGAAELLGIPPSTLNSRMKKLGIRKEYRG